MRLKVRGESGFSNANSFKSFPDCFWEGKGKTEEVAKEGGEVEAGGKTKA